MKKFILASVLVFAAILVSCGSAQTTEADQDSTAMDSVTVDSVAVADSIVVDSIAE